MRGINLVGWFRPGRGFGETARLVRRALEVGGIPHQVIPYLAGSQADGRPGAGEEKPVYDTNLFCLDTDQLRHFGREAGPGFFDGRYNVGLWFWEAEALPKEKADGLRFFDEVWVCSEFVHKVVSAATDLPVRYLPHPMEVSGAADPHAIEWLGLGDRFVYLSVFDFASDLRRKNPMAAIDAFARAFPCEEGEAGPVLVLKTCNGAARPRDLLYLRHYARGHGQVRIVDQYFEGPEMAALMERADCFVSLHRSEALGRALMESMLRGVPCLATGYSGNLQYMDSANSYLCPHRMVGIGKASYPYPLKGQWADPDVVEAARLMREIHDDRKAAAARAKLARSRMEEEFSPQITAAVIGRHLDEIGDRASGVEVEKLPLASMKETAFALLKEELRQGKIGEFRPSGLFRFDFPQVLDLLSRYDAFQRKTHRAVLKAIKESEGEQQRRIRGLEAEVERLSDLVSLLVSEVGSRNPATGGAEEDDNVPPKF